jgi:chaperonin GroEL (HSP60 family)
MQLFVDQEERMIKAKVDNIITTGANVVFCQKGIDDLAQYYLEKAGIYACRRIKKSDMEKLARATGATIVQDDTEILVDDLVAQAHVEERRSQSTKKTFVMGL